MLESTKLEYLRLAESFIASRLQGSPPSPKRLCDALIASALDYRPDSFRRVRRALEIHQMKAGYPETAKRIRQIKNPVTHSNRRDVKAKAKQRRCKSFSVKDEQQMVRELYSRGDKCSLSALYLTKLTGARPSELWKIRFSGDNLIIQGSKKTGIRGADRTIQFTDNRTRVNARKALKILLKSSSTQKQVQDRIRSAAKRIWPKRKALPSLYSYRHQFGSDLKASGLDRHKIAYLMGHQSTASADKYGNKRTGKNPINIIPAMNADLSQIREKHSYPPAPNYEPVTHINSAPQKQNKQQDLTINHIKTITEDYSYEP